MIAVIGGGAAAAVGAGVVVSVLAVAAASGGAFAGQGSSPAVPAQWAGLVAQASAESGLPTSVLAAQLDVESAWNPRAVSPAGAQGLAQFMPGTWATWGGDFDGDGDASAFDPEDAIIAQGRFMGRLFAEASGGSIAGDPIDLALAGYNAGWGAVRSAQGIPPFPETQEYVRRVRLLASTTYAPSGSLGELPMPASPDGAIWPIDHPHPITNGFGDRPRGIRYQLGFHTGIDLNSGAAAADDYGATVRAARAGAVVSSGAGGSLGLEIVVRHPDGYFSSYGHLSASLVTPGQLVSTGQPIGAVGCSGMSSCVPHLHFEVRVQPRWAAGVHVNPQLWLGLPPP